MLFRSDGEIRWAQGTERLYNLVRALARPYPGAQTAFRGRPMKVWRSVPAEGPLPTQALEAVLGTVIGRRGTRLDVRTGDGILTLLEYDPVVVEVGECLGEVRERPGHLCAP